jgi:hypothetical protein
MADGLLIAVVFPGCDMGKVGVISQGFALCTLMFFAEMGAA